MANLPIDRTKLQAAASNQQPSIVASSKANREALVEFADTIDLLNQKVDNLVPVGAVTPAPPSFLPRQAGINGNFDVAQRGGSFTNPSSASYLLDRWQVQYDPKGGTLPTSIIHSQLALNPGDLVGSSYAHRINPNGAGSGFGVDSFYATWQKIENAVRYLCGSGKQVTVSFYARSSIPGKRIGVALRQDYGSGGSAAEDLKASGQIITLTPTLTKYALTFTTNTLSGKTFGANKDDNLRLTFFHMWDASIATAFFGGGTPETFGGSGNIDITQVQLCAGDVALPFQPRSYAEELRLCQRYCQVLGAIRTPLSSFATSGDVVIYIPLRVSMRVNPTLTLKGVRSTDWKLAALNGVENTTGNLNAFSPSNDFGAIYLSGGAYTAGTPYFVETFSATSAIIFDAEI